MRTRPAKKDDLKIAGVTILGTRKDDTALVLLTGDSCYVQACDAARLVSALTVAKQYSAVASMPAGCTVTGHGQSRISANSRC